MISIRIVNVRVISKPKVNKVLEGLTVTWGDYRGRRRGPRPHLGIPKNVVEEEKLAME